MRRAGEPANAEVWGGDHRRSGDEITDEGHLELTIQRDAALDVVFGSADPVSVVLLFAAGERR